MDVVFLVFEIGNKKLAKEISQKSKMIFLDIRETKGWKSKIRRMSNNFNKIRVFQFLISGNQNFHFSLFEHTRLSRSLMSEIRNQQTNFNIPPKKEFLLSDFRSRESKNFNKFKKWIKVPKTKKYEKKGLLKKFIQSKQNNKELTT